MDCKISAQGIQCSSKNILHIHYVHTRYSVIYLFARIIYANGVCFMIFLSNKRLFSWPIDYRIIFDNVFALYIYTHIRIYNFIIYVENLIVFRFFSFLSPFFSRHLRSTSRKKNIVQFVIIN